MATSMQESTQMASVSARVFLIRHGQTDWTVSGKHTSRSEAKLSSTGEDDAHAVRDEWVGLNKLIDPRAVAKMYYCSPRACARRTVEILRLGIHNHQHFYDRETKSLTTTASQLRGEAAESNIQVTRSLLEWDYGEYEGMTLWDIRKMREKQGKGEEGLQWNIWTEGCPGGESPEQISERVDDLICEIKAFIEGTSTSWPSGHISGYSEHQAEDIVCVSHGHILTAMALRWVGAPLSAGQTRMIFEPGGVLVLGFEHDNLNFPAIVVGRRPGKSDRTL